MGWHRRLSRRARRAAAVGILGLVGAAAAIAVAQTPIQSQPSIGPRTAASAVFEAWVPPGTYTAFVISSSGVSRLWPVAIVTKAQRFAVTVRPGENVVIPFPEGWKININDNVRIESDRVPFFDYSLLDPIDGTETFVLHAYGITPNGPVEFTIKPGVPDWVLRRADERVNRSRERK